VSDTTSGATKGYPNESRPGDHLEVPPQHALGGQRSGVQPADASDPDQVATVRESERKLQEQAANDPGTVDEQPTGHLTETGQLKQEDDE
jgi:hypothetical protein